MRSPRLLWPCVAVHILCAILFGLGVDSSRAEEDSLGTKIKKIFEQTPPPKKRHVSVKKKTSPTPAPSASPRKSATPEPPPSPSPKKKKSVAAKESPTPEPAETPTPKPKHSPSPSPSPKHKKKSSPTPEPEEDSPTPKPKEAPIPDESPGLSATPVAKTSRPGGATISPNDIIGVDNYPTEVRKVLDAALGLTSKNLEYKYGSADPESGGLDCSGFIFYVLTQNGFKNVPRDASGQYSWVRKAGNFEAVISRNNDTFELEDLKPGDLLFWTGTYDVEKDPPITHTMIYLGREKKTNQRIMVGASDGRVYHGESRYGVGVFDFKLPRADKTTSSGRSPTFVGYGKIPGLGDG